MQTEPNSVVLRRAKAQMPTADRWCRYSLLDSHGRVCALGAIGLVVYGEEDLYGQRYDLPAVVALAAALPAGYDRMCGPAHAVADYNNTHTYEEVLLLFAKAIEVEEAKELAAEVKHDQEVGQLLLV